QLHPQRYVGAPPATRWRHDLAPDRSAKPAGATLHIGGHLRHPARSLADVRRIDHEQQSERCLVPESLRFDVEPDLDPWNPSFPANGHGWGLRCRRRSAVDLRWPRWLSSIERDVSTLALGNADLDAALGLGGPSAGTWPSNG